MNITNEPACNCGGSITHMAVVIEDQAIRIAALEAENAKLRRQVELCKIHGSCEVFEDEETASNAYRCPSCRTVHEWELDGGELTINENHHPDCPHAEAT